MTSDTSGEFVTLARVAKTQGRHGEVAVEIHSDIPNRFAEGMHLSALLSDGARRDVEIEHLWPHKGLLVLKFAGVNSMSEAERLLRSELQVPRAERARLDQGWSYVSDLAGCLVFDRDRQVGVIEDVQFGAGEAPLLIVVNADGKRFDIPFAEAYLETVNIEKKQVRMKLPEGMLDVNAPVTEEEKSELSPKVSRHTRQESRRSQRIRR